MSLMIDLIIALIILTIVAVGIYNYLPQIDKLLQEKLNISLFRSQYTGPLADIFLHYNHKDSLAWSEWIQSQETSIQDDAVQKLIDHIEASPANWGSITPEAIMGLARFQKRDHMTILKGVLSAARKMWGKFKTCPACYEEACRGMIEIHAESAKNILNEELEQKIGSEEEKVSCIINALKDIPDTVDVNPIFVKILTDKANSFKVRSHAVNSAQARSESEAHQIFTEALDIFIHDVGGNFSGDDTRIFENLLNMVTQDIDDETFDIILRACNSLNFSLTALQAMNLILKSSFKEFTPQQLYMLANLENDKSESIPKTLCDIFNVSTAESELIKVFDINKEYPFKKAPVVEESSTDAKLMEVPSIIGSYYEELKNILKRRSVSKQNGVPGGILLSGYTDTEKIFLARAIASEKRWSFIYGAYEDLVSSSANGKGLQDAINSNKPCIVFIDEISAFLSNQDPVLAKTFKQLAMDHMVFLIATIKDEADINEEGCSVLISGDDELEILFPDAMEISYCTDAFKNKVLNSKLAILEARDHANVESYDINGPTRDMSPFEYEKYLSKYLKASLLIHGELIESTEFEKLDALNFDGRLE